MLFTVLRIFVYENSNVLFSRHFGVLSTFNVPTIVTAHTFCASGDTRVSYGWCLLIQEYFCAP